MLLALLAVLAGVIALGRVEEKTSYGLQFILGALSVLAGGFANWAFGRTEKTPEQAADRARKLESTVQPEEQEESAAGGTR